MVEEPFRDRIIYPTLILIYAVSFFNIGKNKVVRSDNIIYLYP